MNEFEIFNQGQYSGASHQPHYAFAQNGEQPNTHSPSDGFAMVNTETTYISPVSSSAPFPSFPALEIEAFNRQSLCSIHTPASSGLVEISAARHPRPVVGTVMHPAADHILNTEGHVDAREDHLYENFAAQSYPLTGFEGSPRMDETVPRREPVENTGTVLHDMEGVNFFNFDMPDASAVTGNNDHTTFHFQPPNAYSGGSCPVASPRRQTPLLAPTIRTQPGHFPDRTQAYLDNRVESCSEDASPYYKRNGDQKAFDKFAVGSRQESDPQPFHIGDQNGVLLRSHQIYNDGDYRPSRVQAEFFEMHGKLERSNLSGRDKIVSPNREVFVEPSPNTEAQPRMGQTFAPVNRTELVAANSKHMDLTGNSFNPNALASMSVNKDQDRNVKATSTMAVASGPQTNGGTARNTPSRFCHVCTRPTRGEVALVCSNLTKGTCRKVTCMRCVSEIRWDWRTDDGPSWICTHCRKVRFIRF